LLDRPKLGGWILVMRERPLVGAPAGADVVVRRFTWLLVTRDKAWAGVVHQVGYPFVTVRIALKEPLLLLATQVQPVQEWVGSGGRCSASGQENEVPFLPNDRVTGGKRFHYRSAGISIIVAHGPIPEEPRRLLGVIDIDQEGSLMSSVTIIVAQE